MLGMSAGVRTGSRPQVSAPLLPRQMILQRGLPRFGGMEMNLRGVATKKNPIRSQNRFLKGYKLPSKRSQSASKYVWGKRLRSGLMPASEKKIYAWKRRWKSTAKRPFGGFCGGWRGIVTLQ